VSSPEKPESTSSSWLVGDLPLVITCGRTPSNAPLGLPDALPFTLELDPLSGTIRQQRSAVVEQALRAGYGEGAVISGSMDDEGLGKRYADDFLAYVERIVPSLGGKRILEIGCGTGYLLSLLRDRGATVVGIEPGPQGKAGGRRFGVRVVQGFFPEPEVKGPFDIVIAHAVLEHCADPMAFLDSIRATLAENGHALLAVPNCEPYVAAGDLSCLLHQHWSYFTAASLQALTARAGLCAEVQQAKLPGTLYCAATPGPSNSRQVPAGDLQSITQYRQRSTAMLQRLAGILASSAAGGRSIGIYVPGRLINALTVSRQQLPVLKLRFFDDDPNLRGRFYPGFPIAIEGWQDYIDRPVDTMLVVSNTFGHMIRERLDRLGLSEVKVWRDLFP
jgi:2-polyprenyl-3-methyl-5-hydroxy-6-metoxy-1,4-benzoquinol methylase